MSENIDDAGWADVHQLIDADAGRLNMSDADALMVWKIGLVAWQRAKQLGAQFPHDTEAP